MNAKTQAALAVAAAMLVLFSAMWDARYLGRHCHRCAGVVGDVPAIARERIDAAGEGPMMRAWQ